MKAAPPAHGKRHSHPAPKKSRPVRIVGQASICIGVGLESLFQHLYRETPALQHLILISFTFLRSTAPRPTSYVNNSRVFGASSSAPPSLRPATLPENSPSSRPSATKTSKCRRITFKLRTALSPFSCGAPRCTTACHGGGELAFTSSQSRPHRTRTKWAYATGSADP